MVMITEVVFKDQMTITVSVGIQIMKSEKKINKNEKGSLEIMALFL